MYGEKTKKNIDIWINRHLGRLALFNIILMLMVLLRSAGYFNPFFTLSINTIIFILMVLGIILLDFRGRELFFVAIVFLVIAAVFRAVNVEIWAERSSIYTYQAILLAILINFSDDFLARLRKL